MKVTREEATVEILELLLKLRHLLENTDYYIQYPERLLPSIQVRYKRVFAYFACLNIPIKDIRDFYNLEFIADFKDYRFSEEVIDTVNSGIENFYKTEDIKSSNLKEIVSRIIQFRRSYIEILEGFFGGMRIMGAPSVEERVSKTFIIESIKDIDTLVGRLDKIISYLLFPQTQEFDINLLVEKYNFPLEDCKALDKKEWDEYYEGI